MIKNKELFDIFHGLNNCDLFMERLKKNEMWSLFDPDDTPGLTDAYGDKFVELYTKYEKQGLAKKRIKASELFNLLCTTLTQSSQPNVANKDQYNLKSNEKNIGTIKNLNLCNEIAQVSTKDLTAVCTLASLNLTKFVDIENKTIDHEKLYEVTYQVTINLDKIIDVTSYPLNKAEKASKTTRPIGIGVQGLADVFHMLKLSFGSKEALKIDREIFETMYYASLCASCDLSKEYGPYEGFEGSPASQGILRYDMSQVKPSGHWDFDALKQRIKKYGLKNSLRITVMPTASTSQILDKNECVEPYTYNIYKRRVTGGEFQVVNKHLIKELQTLNKWNKETRNRIIKDNGSIKNLDVSDQLKQRFLGAFEMSQKHILMHASAREPFIDQTQSTNIYMNNPTDKKIAALFMLAHRLKLPNTNYYFHTNLEIKARNQNRNDTSVNYNTSLKQKTKNKNIVCDRLNKSCDDSCGG